MLWYVPLVLAGIIGVILFIVLVIFEAKKKADLSKASMLKRCACAAEYQYESSHSYIIAIVFFIAMVIGEVLPEPTDFLAFWIQDWLSYNRGNIAEWLWWTIFIFEWYMLSAFWYALVLLIVLKMKIHPGKKFMVITVVLAIGAVIGVLAWVVNGNI